MELWVIGSIAFAFDNKSDLDIRNHDQWVFVLPLFLVTKTEAEYQQQADATSVAVHPPSSSYDPRRSGVGGEGQAHDRLAEDCLAYCRHLHR
jgi:hypothetical protein